MSFFNPSISATSQSNTSFIQLAQQLRELQRSGADAVEDIVDEQSQNNSQVQQQTEQTGPTRRGREISTGRDEDVNVEGEGFIAVEQGGQQRFTRSVSLGFDEQGNVTDQITGADLQQQLETEDGEIETQNFQLSEEQMNIEARATTDADIEGNLSTDIAVEESTQVETQLRNSEGETETVTLNFTRTGENQFEISATDPNTGETALQAEVNFDEEGQVESTNVAENSSGFEGLTLSTGTGEDIEIAEEDLDLSGLTLQSGETTAEVTNISGNQAGTLENLSVNSEGQLEGTFSNNQTRTFGEVATAEFENAEDLTEVGGGQFVANIQSGEADFSQQASLVTGALESQGGENTGDILGNILAGENVNPGNRSVLLGEALDLFA